MLLQLPCALPSVPDAAPRSASLIVTAGRASGTHASKLIQQLRRELPVLCIALYVRELMWTDPGRTLCCVRSLATAGSAAAGRERVRKMPQRQLTPQ